jgi:NADPH:quinone reductase-like Zn-dependent oxidoreductase
MKAVVYDRYGSADVLRYADVAQPVPGEKDVLVKVHANSLNFGDVAARTGRPGLIRLVMGLRRPRVPILGRDVAGTVTAVGAKVTRFRVGDPVVGELSQGAFAEYVAAPETYFVLKPEPVSFEDAATLPVAANTAVQVLRGARVKAGDHVLVNGASGGVGTFTVQVAKSLGATVTGVCRTRNVELVRSLGADHVVDYTQEDVTRGGTRFDVVIDLVGNHPLAEFRRILTPRGTYIASFGSGGPIVGPVPRMISASFRSLFARQRLGTVAARRNADDLTKALAMVADGSLRPAIERTWPQSETADAIRHLQNEHARGKIVLLA